MLMALFALEHKIRLSSFRVRVSNARGMTGGGSCGRAGGGLLRGNGIQ